MSYGPPDIEGEATDDPEKVEVEKGMSGWDLTMLMGKGVLGCILLPLQPLLVLGALLFRGRQPKEKTMHYLVRVECVDGTLREARFERELRLAKISSGDYVSIWGRPRDGVIVAQHAYNHHVSAKVL